MSAFAMLLATPIFGLALQVHTGAMNLAHVGTLSVESAPTLVAAATADGATVEGEADVDDESRYVDQLRQRESLASVHRVLGISTWAAMTFTVATGFVQYYNLYGVFADRDSNPCVEGRAVFGQGQCSGTPWLHAVGAGLTTGLYISTLTLAMLMPDPDDLASGPGEFASTLRMHRALRWVHLGGMIAQAVLGPIIANSSAFGVDRANSYGTLQALATVHMAAGLVTLGALTWAGALMTF